MYVELFVDGARYALDEGNVGAVRTLVAKASPR